MSPKKSWGAVDRLHYPISSEVGRVSMQAYRPDLPEDQIERLSRQLRNAHIRLFYENYRLWLNSRRHEYVNLERFREEARNGAIVAALHCGAFLSIPTECGRLGYDLRVFLAPKLLKSQGSLFRKLGRRHGIDLQLLDASQPRRMLQALRSTGPGSLMVMMVDGNVAASRELPSEDHTARFEMFGMPMYRRTSVAMLAERSGLPVIPAAEYPVGRKRVLEFGAALPPPTSREPDEFKDYTARVFRSLEGLNEPHFLGWQGWFHPQMFWGETGASPQASVADVQRESDRLTSAWRTGDPELRAASNRYRIGAFVREGSPLLIEAAEKRFMRVPEDVVRLVHAARSGPTLRNLVKKAKCPPEQAIEMLTRLSLAGYVTFEPA